MTTATSACYVTFCENKGLYFDACADCHQTYCDDHSTQALSPCANPNCKEDLDAKCVRQCKNCDIILCGECADDLFIVNGEFLKNECKDCKATSDALKPEPEQEQKQDE